MGNSWAKSVTSPLESDPAAKAAALAGADPACSKAAVKAAAVAAALMDLRTARAFYDTHPGDPSALESLAAATASYFEVAFLEEWELTCHSVVVTDAGLAVDMEVTGSEVVAGVTVDQEVVAGVTVDEEVVAGSKEVVAGSQQGDERFFLGDAFTGLFSSYLVMPLVASTVARRAVRLPAVDIAKRVHGRMFSQGKTLPDDVGVEDVREVLEIRHYKDTPYLKLPCCGRYVLLDPISFPTDTPSSGPEATSPTPPVPPPCDPCDLKKPPPPCDLKKPPPPCDLKKPPPPSPAAAGTAPPALIRGGFWTMVRSSAAAGFVEESIKTAGAIVRMRAKEAVEKAAKKSAEKAKEAAEKLAQSAPGLEEEKKDDDSDSPPPWEDVF